tara:strand:+ start:71 stop:382 length:312 start_codon:yes stop_codon:yes gene_type:complete
MKLTESRIKEIIFEELRSLSEVEPEPTAGAEEPPQDDTKTLAALKKFMIVKAKEVGSVKGASAIEVKQIAEMIDLMFGLVGKGEISKYLAYGIQQIQKKAGVE